MKTLIALLFYVAVLPNVNSQTQPAAHKNFIDSIETAEQIHQLLHKVDTTDRYQFWINYQLKFPGNSCQQFVDSLNLKPWVKADFDGNGLTDLMVIGNICAYTVVCILDKGQNNYQITFLNPSFLDKRFIFATVVSDGNTPFIRYFRSVESISDSSDLKINFRSIDIIDLF